MLLGELREPIGVESEFGAVRLGRYRTANIEDDGAGIAEMGEEERTSFGTELAFGVPLPCSDGREFDIGERESAEFGPPTGWCGERDERGSWADDGVSQ